MEARSKRILIGIVAGHTLLLAVYTFPRQIVPERLRVLGQLYARPLFHQQWRLFAPDPPLCDCRLQWSTAATPWSYIEYRPGGYLHRRTLQSLARHVQSEVHAGDTVPAPELVSAMRGIVVHGSFDPGPGRTLPELRFRLVERCVIDPGAPAIRAERVTPLRTP